MAIVTRFAPSPTGYLHLGHAFAARIAHQQAGQSGRFLLRLEDIDPQRCRPAFAQAALEDLAWLGLAWQGPVRTQSNHLPEYRATLESLAARGLAYPCFCSRAAVARETAAAAHAPHAPDGAPLYPGTCRHIAPSERAARLAAGAPHAWRLNMHAALHQAGPLPPFHTRSETGTQSWQTTNPAPFGDVVLGRRDIPASYHLCVTHDDALQGVTLVTRAADLLPATHLHVLLQRLMGWATPSYLHHPLLAGPDGARLSKRAGAPAVRDLRAQGFTPGMVWAQLEKAVLS